MRKLELVFGTLADPIKDQLKAKKLRLAAGASVEQEDADAIVRLHLHDILTDSQVLQARLKLLKRICRLVKPIGERSHEHNTNIQPRQH